MELTPRVFVCHSSVDASLARDIVSELESAGIPCWIAPRDVVSGENYPRQLVHAIQECATFLVLITPASVRSDHVLRELEQAARHRRPVLPLVVDGASSEDLDYYLGALHRVEGSERTIVAEAVRHFAGAGNRGPRRASVGSTGATPPPSRGSDLLRVGVIPWPPFARHASGAGPSGGLFLDLLDQFSVDTGIPFEYVDITNDAATPGLLSGDLDLVACLYRTPRRERDFDFAACLFASTIGAVVRADDQRIRSHGDLLRTDVRLAVCRGEIGAELAVDMFGAARGSSRLVELDTTDVANVGRMVQAGVADAAITDNITCRLICEALGASVRHEFAHFPLYVGHIGLQMLKGREPLRDHLTERLQALRRGGTLAEAQRELESSYAGMLQVL
ncbi:TIR domain-containing protein [Actinotalea solisilvae]|uniref:TIR domain-containing protein n=1 Tax=Actinotalea solisilvae TaxID=2072922 RepID=UPI0018F1346C|nr:transporter substrate-binding domain-containing protein [Actinotalea solisilvae]